MLKDIHKKKKVEIEKKKNCERKERKKNFNGKFAQTQR